MSDDVIHPRVNWELCTEDILVIRQSIMPHVADIKYAAMLAPFYRNIFCLAEREVSPVGYAEIKIEHLRLGVYAVHEHLVKEHPDCQLAGYALNTADIVLFLLEAGMLYSMDHKLYLKHIACMKLTG